MKVKIEQAFSSGVLGYCDVGDEVECDEVMARAIIGSRLGSEMPERIIRRRKKRISRRAVETAAIEVETA